MPNCIALIGESVDFFWKTFVETNGLVVKIGAGEETGPPTEIAALPADPI